MGFSKKEYPTYKEYKKALLECRISKDWALELAEHERDHFEKARELGYSPIYVSHIIPDTIDIVYGEVDWPEKESPQDLIVICLAPKKPGEEDITYARRSLNLIKYGTTIKTT